MFVLFFPKQQSVKRVVLMQRRFPDISKPSKHVLFISPNLHQYLLQWWTYSVLRGTFDDHFDQNPTVDGCEILHHQTDGW
jgi:hypothetical protein